MQTLNLMKNNSVKDYIQNPSGFLNTGALSMMHSMIHNNNSQGMTTIPPPPPLPSFLLTGENNSHFHNNPTSFHLPQPSPYSTTFCKKPSNQTSIFPNPLFPTQPSLPLPIPLSTMLATSASNSHSITGSSNKRPSTLETYEKLLAYRNALFQHQLPQSHIHNHNHHHPQFHHYHNMVSRFPFLPPSSSSLSSPNKFYKSNFNTLSKDPYCKGQLIQLKNGELKPVEMLSVSDFETTLISDDYSMSVESKNENSLNNSNSQSHVGDDLELVEGKVLLIEVKHDDNTARIHLETSKNKQSILVIPISKPLFCKPEGWCSIEPASCLQQHHLNTSLLQLDHIVLCLVRKRTRNNSKSKSSRRHKSHSYNSTSSMKHDVNNNQIIKDEDQQSIDAGSNNEKCNNNSTNTSPTHQNSKSHRFNPY